MDRAFFVDHCADLRLFSLKPGAVSVSARWAGTTATIDQMNKYLLYAQMSVVSSRYWNMVHGQTLEQVMEDEEGVQIMRVLGYNMAWLLKCIEAGKKNGIEPPVQEDRINTNFIR
jgi:multimeric flavodoxin WrbA